MNLVVYENGIEILICTKKDEKKLIKEYFTKGGRDLEEYDRSVCVGVLEIKSSMNVSCDQVVK